MWELCKIYRKEPDDPWFENMSPIKKLWMYESWRADLADQHEFARSYSIFTGSFYNMELAQRLISAENPDYKSTEEDFEQTVRMVEESFKKPKQVKRRRRRRVVNG